MQNGVRKMAGYDSIPRQERQEAAERLQSAEEKLPGMEFCISIVLGACKGICTEKEFSLTKESSESTIN